MSWWAFCLTLLVVTEAGTACEARHQRMHPWLFLSAADAARVRAAVYRRALDARNG